MTLDTAFFWISVVAYALAVLLTAAAIVFGKPWASRWSWNVSLGAFLAHTLSISARWIGSGRLPYVQDFENLLLGTWVVMGLYVAIAWRRPALRPTGLGVLPFVLLSLGVAATMPAVYTPATAPYKSIWLGVHVTFAWATYAAYTICASLGILELLSLRHGSKSKSGWLERVPSVEALEGQMLRFVGYGFLVNTVMITTGAIWAHDLWGSYWQWDPVETWSLLTWLAYGFYLHAYYTLGWRRKPLAWTAIFALFGVLMCFWGVQLFPSSYHLFRDLGSTAPQVGRP